MQGPELKCQYCEQPIQIEMGEHGIFKTAVIIPGHNPECYVGQLSSVIEKAVSINEVRALRNLACDIVRAVENEKRRENAKTSMSIKDDFGPNSIVSRFDANNAYHVRAYLHLEQTGAWPENFLDTLGPQLFIPSGHMGMLRSKMVDAWCKHITEAAKEEDREKNGG